MIDANLIATLVAESAHRMYTTQGREICLGCERGARVRGGDHSTWEACPVRRLAAAATELIAQRDTPWTNLEIVNGWLVERGANLPRDYPVPGYGPMPYSDAEPIVRLDTIDGWPGEKSE